MRTKKEIQELGMNIVESAKNVSWKNAEQLHRITKNIYYLERSIQLLDQYPSKIDLLFLKAQLATSKDKADKTTVDCINYILKISAH